MASRTAREGARRGAKQAVSDRISRWLAAGSPTEDRHCRVGTLPRDRLEARAIPGGDGISRICVVEGTVVFITHLVRPMDASNMSAPPVAVTVTSEVLELIVKGPTRVPAGPLWDVGVIVSVGDCGAGSGGSALTWLTMSATYGCSGSPGSSTYRSLKYQIAAWTAAAR